MKNRVALGIIAVILAAWAALPDPLPLLWIDDAIAVFGMIAAILKLIRSFFREESAT